MVAVQVPDLVGLYEDHVIHKYQKKLCTAKGKKPENCQFDVYYDTYSKENPTLTKMGYYFQLGEGPLFYIVSGRCSHKIFNNVSAAGKESGKISQRQYFWTKCSQFDMDVSDFIFREKSTEGDQFGAEVTE